MITSHLINAPTTSFFCGKKADQMLYKSNLITPTFLIFVQNVSKTMPYLELLSELQCLRGVLLTNL